MNSQERRKSVRKNSIAVNDQKRKSKIINHNEIAFFGEPQKKADKDSKFISCQGLACFILQLLSFYEIACVVIAIHSFLINDRYVSFSLSIVFFVLSKTLKILYFVKIKQIKMCILIVLCLDYLAIYFKIRRQRKENTKIEQTDKEFRKDWEEVKKKQQMKIDRYIESIEPKRMRTPSQKSPEPKKKQYNIQKEIEKNKLSKSNYDNYQNTQQTPSKLNPNINTVNTQINNTQTSQKDPRNMNNYTQTQTSGEKMETQQRDSPQKNDQANQNYIQTEQNEPVQLLTQESQHENAQLNRKQNEDNQRNQLTIKTDYSNQINTSDNQQRKFQNLNLVSVPTDQGYQQNKSPRKIRLQDEKNQQSPTSPKKRVLETKVRSSIFKKFRLSTAQISVIITNQFKTVYLDDIINENDENYFTNRKFILCINKIIDGIFVTAPILYMTSCEIANYYESLDLINLLYFTYWSFTCFLSISIALFLNLQLVPFRQHHNYFYIQLKSFCRDFVFALSTVVSTSILWGLCSRHPLALGIYYSTIFVVMVHQIFSLLRKVYYEQSRRDINFKMLLFLVCFVFTILIGCLLLFANLIIIINSGLIHEALLQLRYYLEQKDVKYQRDELFILEEKSRVCVTFVIRQNMFFVINILGLFILNFFFNDIFNLNWNDEMVTYHKFLFGFSPVCLLGVLLKAQDYKFFKQTLNEIIYSHLLRLQKKIEQKEQEIFLKQKYLEELTSEFKEIEQKMSDFTIEQLTAEDHKKILKADLLKLSKSIQGRNPQKEAFISLKIQEFTQHQNIIQLKINDQKELLIPKKEHIQEVQSKIKALEEILNQLRVANGIILK